MRVGFYVTGSAGSGYGDLLDQIEYADRSGFDSVWLRERHFHTDHAGRNFFSSPFLVAAYVAARTSRVRIGMGARILPLDHPIHIAEGAATVDLISGGRLDLGVARIGENDLYQRAFGVPDDEVRGRFEEALDVIVAAWTERPVSYEGEHYSIPSVSVEPRPAQRPHPPIYLVGISAQTLALGASRGLPLLLAGAQPVPVVRRTQERYYGLLEEDGHARRQVDLPLNRFIYVAETRRQAIEDTKDTIMAFLGRNDSVIRDFMSTPESEITYELLLDQVCVFGDPDHCVRQIEELGEQVDLRDLILTFNYFTIETEKCRRSMELFVEEVLPRLRRRPAAAPAISTAAGAGAA